jgi:hypothetical protein
MEQLFQDPKAGTIEVGALAPPARDSYIKTARARPDLARRVLADPAVDPVCVTMRDALEGRGPIVAFYRVNAGPLAPGHWLNDPGVGGGRIIGEGCHIVGCLAFLTGNAAIDSVGARAEEIAALIAAVTASGPTPSSPTPLFATRRATLRVHHAIASGAPSPSDLPVA